MILHTFIYHHDTIKIIQYVMVKKMDNKTTQYVIMTDENKTEHGYIPNIKELIANAPNDEMKAEWNRLNDLIIKSRDDESLFTKPFAFTYNGIYMMKMECGHNEIFQHNVRNETELVEWIELMHEDKNYKKCTKCICG